MLDKRILATLKFFDLQNLPLTYLEVHRFLITDLERCKELLDEQYELKPAPNTSHFEVGLDTVIQELDALINKRQLGQKNGFYYLPGRQSIVSGRIKGYTQGIDRERLINKYVHVLQYFPFVRGVALAGSQALGLAKPDSDIDLFIITHKKFMWIARLLVTSYFQIFGVRRHGLKISNRFCLNHYMGKVREITEHRNLYTAVEYGKLRPLVFNGVIEAFQLANQNWINVFCPEALTGLNDFSLPEPPSIQKFFERILNNQFGNWLEVQIKNKLLPRIRSEKYIVVKEDELSFHPNSKQETLLMEFFEGYQHQNGELVQLIV
jgi:predicted nucleotidyltransferase